MTPKKAIQIDTMAWSALTLTTALLCENKNIARASAVCGIIVIASELYFARQFQKTGKTLPRFSNFIQKFKKGTQSKNS